MTVPPPSSTGGPISRFSISPSLPSGIVLNTTTGEIINSALYPLQATEYTITAHGMISTTYETKLIISTITP